MKPTAWFSPYFSWMNRSMPSTTYSRHKWVSNPAIRLHSMIACGSCSPKRKKISTNASGMSVRPSGSTTLLLDRDSVPGSTQICLYGESFGASFCTQRIPSRKRSVIRTSPALAFISAAAHAYHQPLATVIRMTATISGPSSMNSLPKAGGGSYGILKHSPLISSPLPLHRHLPTLRCPSNGDALPA